MELSPAQTNLLMQKLNINIHTNKTNQPSVDYAKPFGYSIPTSNFNAIQCKNYELAPPGPFEVQIEAKAVSLNFRDLMIGLGLYPNMEGIPSIMGGDYAGVIVACGKQVRDLKVGDEVVSLYVGDSQTQPHFGSRINALIFQTALKPKHLSFQEACCIPTVFITAHYGLHHKGQLCENETVLIHTAAGGVGLAAIQVAKWKKAYIFATAGNENKRSYLQTLGVQQVMNSRSLEFYDLILQATDGRGLDVVLNTLAGEAMEKGILLLQPHGRFIQIDKTDIFQKRMINLELFKKAISYIFVDISQFYMDLRIDTLLKEVIHLFNQRVFSPLPLNLFPHNEVSKALNFMSLGNHIGKIVLNFEKAKIL